MICLDASLVLAWLLPEDLSPQARFMKDQWDNDGEEFVAPTFLQLEVTSVLRNYVFRQALTLEEGDEAISTFRALPLRYYPTELLVIPGWEAAKRVNAPRVYDMIYLALAESLSCFLWTGDRRLSRLVAAHTELVNWLGDVAT